MILSVFPAAGSSDDSNQNSTISDETLTQEEPVSDVPKEKTIISEPETPDIVEQEEVPEIIEGPVPIEEPDVIVLFFKNSEIYISLFLTLAHRFRDTRTNTVSL